MLTITYIKNIRHTKVFGRTCNISHNSQYQENSDITYLESIIYVLFYNEEHKKKHKSRNFKYFKKNLMALMAKKFIKFSLRNKEKSSESKISKSLKIPN